MRGTSRAIVNADQFNVRRMLFRVRRDLEASVETGVGVSFHSGMDLSLLFAAIFYVAFGLFCLFEATPKEGAHLVAAVAFGIAAVFLFLGGLATELTFRRDLRQMDVSWRFFSFGLISHSHPFSEIGIRIRVPGTVSSTGRLGYMEHAKIFRRYWAFPLPIGISRKRSDLRCSA